MTKTSGSVNVIIFWERKGLEFKRLPVANERVHVSASWRPKYNLSDFIPYEITKKSWQIWKRARIVSYLILRENVDHAMSPTGFDFDPHWSMEESQKLVAKFIAQSLETAKPMTFWQILPLYVMGAVTMGGMLYLVSRIL